MGRLTEFFDFINRELKPTPLEMKSHYTSLTLTYKIQDIRKGNLKKGEKWKVRTKYGERLKKLGQNLKKAQMDGHYVKW